tara:strand:- start:169 stop:2760 length:2592 start_codon:yes stop_codon:yes gene_type:complete
MVTDAKPPTPHHRLQAVFNNPVLRLAVGGLIFLIAIVVLYTLIGEISWSSVKMDIAAQPYSSLLLSGAFTALSFLALSLYDVFAVQLVAPGKIPFRVAAFAGASGYAVSNLLGFTWLTGGAVRAKIYSNLNLNLAAVGSVIATIWFSFWLGISILVGLLLAFHPEGISATLGIDKTLETSIGVALLVAISALFWWLSKGGRTVGIAGFHLRLPNAKLAFWQSLIAVFDIISAALALYVLLPADITSNFVYFFVVFVAAMGLGLVSHSPGGLGVFEATLVAGLGATARPDVLASLVLFRLIYYLLPFCIVAVTAAVLWISNSGKSASRVVHIAKTIISPMIPFIAAGLALMTGTMLTISGGLPAETSRLRFLEDLVPLSFVETSHLMASFVGVLLIVVARGLYRKNRNAWFAAAALLIIGAIASLSKGFDWEESLIVLSALLLLVVFRSAFYRASVNPLFHLSGRWIAISLTAIAASLWVGFFAYSNVPYSNQLWWDFAWDADAPRYLRASLVIAVVFAAISINSLINSTGASLQAEPVPDRVRQLIAASADPDAYINLTGDKRFLLSEEGTAFLAYADGGSSLICRGDPIGDTQAAEALILQLRGMADKLGKKCAFYSVSSKYLPSYVDMGFAILKIGETARVDLTGFTLEGSSKKDLRQARNKAMREGYRFEILHKADLDAEFQRLQEISDDWLLSKHGEEKRFSVGAFDKDYLANFNHAVLRREDSGKIIAFASLLEGADSHEFAIDLMRYDPQGPGFAMDALFAELLLWGAARNYHWFSLGAAPFSGFDNHAMATVWNRIGHLIYTHGEHFYNFEGLRSFKEKFDPVWTPNYLAVPRILDAPRVLYEVNNLVSGGLKGVL